MITIDPGVGGTAVVYWGDELQPRYIRLISPSRKNSGEAWIDRVKFVMDKFNELLLDLSNPGIVLDVYIEYPSLFESATGLAAAAGGDLVKLTFLVGGLSDRVWVHGHNVKPLRVNDWKGQLPKEVINKRACAILGREELFPDHIGDAVGMGLFVKGLLNVSGTRRPKQNTV